MPFDFISRTADSPVADVAKTRSRRGRVADAWGRAAEESVARVYRDRGGEIIALRKRTPAGEIDLIVKQDGVMAFVEVKARKRSHDALVAMSTDRWRRLALAAEMYLSDIGDPLADFRIDLATVDGAGAVSVHENVSFDF